MNSPAKILSLAQLDELEEIRCCLTAIADLMNPCDDLHTVNRDGLAMLLSHFTDRLLKVTRRAE